MKPLIAAATAILMPSCAMVPISFTIGYKEASVGMTWQPAPSAKNPIRSGK